MDEIGETRQVFRDLLRLLSSKEKQSLYQEQVPIADVPAELVCQWFDDHYHPDTEWFQQAFSLEERQILKELNSFYDQRVKGLPDTLPELLEDPTWDEVIGKAKETLEAIDW